MTPAAELQLGAAADPAGPRAVSDDGALVRRAQQGDTRAFGQLVRRYERRVLALARRAAGGLAEAEDIAQEVFLKAWRAIGRFDPDLPLDAWLMTIGARVARTHAARERRRRLLRFGVKENGHTPAPASNAPGERADRNLWREADRLLPLEARLALWLRHGEHQSSRAIGAALGKSEVAVRQMIRRSHRTLREALADDEGRNANADSHREGRQSSTEVTAHD